MASDAEATVHFDATSVEVVRLEDVRRSACDLFGFTESIGWNHALDFGEGFGFHAGDHLGGDKAGCDRSSADTVTCELLGPGHSHRGDTGFGRGVVGLSNVSFFGDAGDVDQDTFLLTQDHMTRSFTSTQECSREVDVDDLLPLFEAHLGLDLAVLGFDKQRISGDPCVIDQTIDAFEVLVDLREARDDRVLFCDVTDISASVASGAAWVCAALRFAPTTPYLSAASGDAETVSPGRWSTNTTLTPLTKRT